MNEKTEALEDKISGAAEYLTDREVRMECIHLVADSAAAISPLMTEETLIKRADALAQYVLTGKKPGETVNG